MTQDNSTKENAPAGGLKEKIGWHARMTITKYENDEAYKEGRPFDVSKAEGNLALNEGLQALVEAIGGISAVTLWDNANAFIGVGTDNSAAAAQQTGLLGATKTFAGMDTGFPQRTNQSLEFQAVFGGAEANHGWQEFTIANQGDDAGNNLNRLVSDQGTKQSGQTWTVKIDLDFS